MNNDAVIQALRQALAADPRNGPLWIHLADQLMAGGDRAGAIEAVRMSTQIRETARAAGKRLVSLLREDGQLAEALIRAEALLDDDEDPDLRAELELILELRGGAVASDADLSAPAEIAAEDADDVEPAAESSAAEEEAREPALAPIAAPGADEPDENWADQFDWGDLRVTFSDVAGLDDVKKQINLRIIAPFTNPDVYRAFGRDGGGGLLMYGPPGCGKTYLARATAGELSARFVSVSIHEIIDKYWGESEKYVHALFEDARSNSPTVLFFDEFDALGASRGRGDNSFWRVFVDQMLQEMDGVDSRNRDVLLFAATNMPWNVDPAFRRPGRFDRVLLVTPPDAEARRQILTKHLAEMPGGRALDVDAIVAKTELYTGADLRHLCERAGEAALELSLTSGEIHDVTQAHVKAALGKTQSTALEWFATARNHARYANEGGQYDDLVSYLKAIRKW